MLMVSRSVRTGVGNRRGCGGWAAGVGAWRGIAELHRLRGVVLAEQVAKQEAESDLTRACSIAQEQDAAGWSLRAATSLAVRGWCKAEI